jgi:hypothetical protein
MDADDFRPAFGLARKPRTTVLAMIAIAALLASSAASAQVQPQATSDVKMLIEDGRKQLREAHAAGTEAAYQAAEDTFDRAVALDLKNGLPLAYRGAAKLERSGWLAAKGNFDASGTLLEQASADLDRAVALSPDDLSVRLLRGTSYAEFPPFLKKGPLAREDFDAAVRHPQFAAQSAEARARVYLISGKLFAAAGESDKAKEAWSSAVAAGPQTTAGAAAQQELKKLELPAQAADSQGRRREDRFPQISEETTPVIVAASVTLPGHVFSDDPSTWHPKMREFLDHLKLQPGLLAMHRLASLDHPGMLVILTWWENKRALNNWFYSDVHQGMIDWVYGGPGAASGNALAGDLGERQMKEAGQVAMEIFTTLPGGIQYGGGLGPKLPERPRSR